LRKGGDFDLRTYRHRNKERYRHFTLNAIVWLCVAPPPEAVTVTVDVLTAALPATFNVSPLVPLPGVAMLAEENVAVTPVGNPLIESVTTDLNPFTAAVVKLNGNDPPRATVTCAPASDSVKSGPITVRTRV
jgi:hypothetical protein